MCACVKTEVKKWSVKCSWDYFISSQWVPAVKDIISLRTRPYTCTAHLSFHSSVLIKQRFQGVKRPLERTPELHTQRVDLQVRWVPYRPRPLSFVNTVTSLTFQTRVQQSHKCTLTHTHTRARNCGHQYRGLRWLKWFSNLSRLVVWGNIKATERYTWREGFDTLICWCLHTSCQILNSP